MPSAGTPLTTHTYCGLPSDPIKNCHRGLAKPPRHSPWWRHHQMETFSASQALCAGNSPVIGEFPSQRPVTRGFDVFLDLRLNKWLSRHSRRRWFETPSRSPWRRCNVSVNITLGHPWCASTGLRHQHICRCLGISNHHADPTVVMVPLKSCHGLYTNDVFGRSSARQFLCYWTNVLLASCSLQCLSFDDTKWPLIYCKK